MKDVIKIELKYTDTIADLENVIRAFNEQCSIEYLLDKIIIKFL